ncbi:TRAPP trafficking subunit Trs65-domain-containing protein [Gongronella butleri]|nr:TRAPP trafficking subunit Trs65-domain-containing protein [Gongronella butleri]
MATVSNVSTELFFNETQFKVLIPNLDYSDAANIDYTHVINAPEARSFAFYDEQLRVYLYARLPTTVTGSGQEVVDAVHHFFQQLDIHMEASIQDLPLGTPNAGAFTAAHVPTVAPSSSTPLSAMSSAPSSPQLTKRDPAQQQRMEIPPFFSHTYNGRGQDPEPMLFEHENAQCGLFPIDVPIVYMKTRGNQPGLAIHFSIAYRPLPSKGNVEKEPSAADQAEYDVNLFDTVDLLQGLGQDPVFSMLSNQPPSQHFIMESRSRQANGSDAPATTAATAPAPAQFLTLRTQVRDAIPLRSGINVKMRTTNANVTDKTVMMSVELENPADAGCEFLLSHMDVQVSHAVVAPAFAKDTDASVHLNKSDQMVFVYNVTLLEDGSAKPPATAKRMFTPRRATTSASAPPVPPPQDERIQPQRVVIHVYGAPIVHGRRAQMLRSKWNTMLDVSSLRQRRDEPHDPRFTALLTSNLTRTQTSVANSIANSPRSIASPASHHPHQHHTHPSAIGRPNTELPSTATHRAPEFEVADGIVISFTAPDTVTVGKIFSLQLFIVNRSKHTRRFQVMIPNRRRQPAPDVIAAQKSNLAILPIKQSPVDPYMEEAEFLQQYFENETHEADIISLENNINLCPLGPSTSQTVDIRFIAVKEKLHTVDLVQLVDQDTGFVTNLRHVLEVFVEHGL